MINSYEIKKVMGEDVLYLFLDFTTDFAKTDAKQKKKTLNKEVNDYIEKEKIKFKGSKIILMASGLVIGACLLKTPATQSYQDSNYKYTTNLITLNEDFSDKNKLDEIIENVVEKEVQVEQKTDTKKEVASTNNKTQSTTSSNNTNKKNTNTNTNTKETKPTLSDNTSSSINNSTPSSSNVNNKVSEEITKKEEVPTSPIQNKTMVSIKRSNGSIITLELEEYLIGVVGAEMPASFSGEALKAQAIAARTYALKAIQNGVQLTDTVSTQVYKDNSQLQAMWGSGFNSYYAKIKNAVLSTEGLAMYYNNELINAYYHSTSNGYTEDSTAVFGYAPYLKSVESSVDKNVASYLKTISLSYEEVSNKLGIPVTSLSNISIERNSSDRISKIIIDNNVYDGVKFRMTLGLRSTDFDVVLNENDISITTRGYGHGVGMSQYGAHEYAKLGWNYKQILTHYYTGITIKKY